MSGEGTSLIEEAAAAEAVQDEVRALAERHDADALRAGLEEAFAAREIDAATALALALLAKGEVPDADAVVRIYPDALSDRAAQVLVASHPERLAVLPLEELNTEQLHASIGAYFDRERKSVQ